MTANWYPTVSIKGHSRGVYDEARSGAPSIDRIKKGHHEGITNRSKNVIIEDEEEHEDEHEGRQLFFVIRTRRRPRSRYNPPYGCYVSHFFLDCFYGW